MNKQQTTIVVIIVIVLGLFLYYKNADAPAVSELGQNQATTTDTTSASTSGTVANVNSKGEYIVTYNGVNFSPKTLTIAAGKSVVFINQSSKSMWVASDPHPSHDNYPEFDEDKTVGTGGTFHFTFVKTGVWGFHNHNNPSATGTILVK